ncbi:MAG: hemerythrin domain-containing protein [Candidatus Acidiferrales bacterium]
MITNKAVTFLMLVAGLLCGSHDVRPQAARESTMKFPIPQSIELEHQELHAALERLTQAGGETSEAARAVEKVLSHHFEKEEQYALPPLGLLVPLSQGKFEPAMAEVLKLTDKLEAEMPVMLSEHKELIAALEKLSEAAKAEKKAEGVRFAEELTMHAQGEEEITYPAALLVGRYVKSKLASMRANSSSAAGCCV